MARILNPESFYSVKRNLIERIKTNLGGIYTGEDSTVNIIGDSVSEEMNKITSEAQLLYNKSQLSNATGIFLDKIAFDLYGLLRKGGSYAESTSRERNVYFYVETGSFGDINSNQAIVIPKGTLISSSEDDGFGTDFYTTEEILLLPENNNIFVGVRASNFGSDYNVEKETLINHNFRNYSDYLNNTLKVENRFAIINGSDEETDERFKYRVTNYITDSTNKNLNFLRLSALEVPGVMDVEVISSYYGIGTVGVVVFSNGRESNRDLVSLTEARLLELSYPGQNAIVSEGIDVFVDLDVRFYYKENPTEIELNESISRIKRSIMQLIKEAEFSRFISFEDLSNLIRSEIKFDNSITFGTNEKNNIFENVYIRKTDKYGLLQEEKIEVLESYINVNRDERIKFGSINVYAERDPR